MTVCVSIYGSILQVASLFLIYFKISRSTFFMFDFTIKLIKFTGKCTKDKECDKSAQQTIKCKPDEKYCAESKKCVPDDDSAGNNETKNKKCPPGTAYCLETGLCKPLRQGRQLADEIICPEGSVYCAEFGKCSPSCGVAVGGNFINN